ncbi:MAG TPA: helix-turn-helix transcriptional regulator [Terriglobales bacterium]
MVAADEAVSRLAGAIGEPARTRMLYSLFDGRARTGTELAMIAGVTPSTASVHLQQLLTQRLVKVMAQGRHRYYSLQGKKVAEALEALSVLAGSKTKHEPRVPSHLRQARTCYDHIAGVLGVSLHDRLVGLGWLQAAPKEGEHAYQLSQSGAKAFSALGVDTGALCTSRRRVAYGCLDWSERRFHLGGAAGAALLTVALSRKWVSPDPDSRSLELTARGRREMQAQFGLRM